MLAIVDAKRAGLLGRRHWASNIIAGLIVGVVALPLAMAFAIASGVKPEQGIYTAIVAGIAVSLFGGSRVQIAGPTGAFIVILSGIVATHGVEGLQIATLMAGVILLLFGVARMGAIIKFIPVPVIAGFTAGIGVIIWVGQWKDFFGLPAVEGLHFHQKLWNLLQVLPQMDPATTGLALLSLALLIFLPRIPTLSRVPGPLVALVVVTLIQAVFGFESVATIGSTFGEIPSGLPAFKLPEITLVRLVELIGPAFAIAMLGAIESLLSAVVADGMAGTRHNSNQELIGQGLANVLAPMFGGIAATGAIARTATNIRNGGNSPIAGIVHALTLVLVLILLAPLAAGIPLATLAAILFMVAWNMSELRHVVRLIKRAPRADVVILLVTFGLTVFADLVVAVNIGVVLAMLHFLRRMAESVVVRQQDGGSLQRELGLDGSHKLPADILVYAVEGPFFFAAVDTFERVLADTHTDPRVVIIRLAHVPFMDATGLKALDEAIQELHQRGVRVILTEANEKVQKKLKRMGLTDKLGSGCMTQHIGQAWARAEQDETGDAANAA
ncbi:SulP family inorganic anion transporter [Pollutimonas thiosulfatoxidans]|uniref:Sodium-independent anion transporter n=1 Tax=Pollutimonas thiosulfatoxidans TaxID=2028345 RepID=A0A410G9D3_9BURK|nr:SulP family inorganic anion transporter [Pollutimonas thiosulfatoxidans]QAA92896.1 sodium-independent anion transporter [Pollutimonas thiosulfatoxidans]